MLRNGVPLDQAGLVLRHRSIDMTAYYAKADVALAPTDRSAVAGGVGMMASVETYLAVRRAVGFTLSNTEYLLRSFADFAADLKGNAYPHCNSHRLGQPSEIGCATTHTSPDHLPLCAIPSHRRLPALITTVEPLRLPENSSCPAHLFTLRD